MNGRKLAAFALGPVGSALLGLVTVPVVAWYFPIEDVGRITMLMVAVSFCLLFFSLGLDQAYVREFHESGDRTGLFHACLVPGFLLLLLAAGLAWSQATSVGAMLFDQSTAALGRMVIACVLASFLLRYFSLILRMQERGLAFSVSQILVKAVFLAMVGVGVVMAPSSDVSGLLASHTVALASVAAATGWVTRTQWCRRGSWPSASQMRHLLTFGLPLIFSGLGFWAMTSLDRVFLRHMSSLDQLGLYSVANSFAGVALVLQSVFSTVWAPMAYRLHKEGAPPSQLHRVSERVVAVVTVVFAAGGLLSGLTPLLLPAEYAPVQYILVACLGYPLLYTLSEATGIGLGITRRSGHVLLATMLALFVNVIANFFWVPRYGASGAACATALAFLALFVLRTEMSNRLWAPMPRARVYLLAVSSTGLAISFALYGARYPTAFAALWLLLLAFAGGVWRHEWRELISWMHRGRPPGGTT